MSCHGGAVDLTKADFPYHVGLIPRNTAGIELELDTALAFFFHLPAHSAITFIQVEPAGARVEISAHKAHPPVL